jgi:hypothetical protein
MNEEGGSPLKSVASMGVEAFTSLTIGNPFFTRRIGTVGWDPVQSPWLSKMNRVLAPRAHRYRYLVNNQIEQQGYAKFYQSQVLRGGTGAKYAELATEARRRAAQYMGKTGLGHAEVTRMAKSKPTGWFTGATKMIGEHGFNELDEHMYKRAAAEFGAKAGEWKPQWVTKMWGGKGIGKATQHAALMYGVGRVATGANAALLVYDAARLLFKPVEILAGIGNSARTQPTTMMGPGIREPGMAATMRQQAIMQMQSSDFGPRSVIGNEAPFLHV